MKCQCNGHKDILEMYKLSREVFNSHIDTIHKTLKKPINPHIHIQPVNSVLFVKKLYLQSSNSKIIHYIMHNSSYAYKHPFKKSTHILFETCKFRTNFIWKIIKRNVKTLSKTILKDHQRNVDVKRKYAQIHHHQRSTFCTCWYGIVVQDRGGHMNSLQSLITCTWLSFSKKRTRKKLLLISSLIVGDNLTLGKLKREKLNLNY
jgi:hypothetical protein